MTKALVLTSALGVTGCVPLYVKDTSQVVGVITDAETKTAVPGARLYCAEYPNHSVTSDKSGAFEIKPNKKWAWVFLAGDYLSQNCTLIAEAAGYRSLQTRVWDGDTTLQQVTLERSSK